jgi:hypothetical protein
MSTNRSTGSTVKVWTLAVLAVPFLYVATWPPIEKRFVSYRPIPGAAPRILRIFVGFESMVQAYPQEKVYPAWIESLYAPLRRFARCNGGSNPLALYEGWWEQW